MDFIDTLTIDAPRKTEQGFLVASVRAARTGIQEYTGREVDPDNEHGLRDQAIVRVYRGEDEVFAADSLRSFSVLDVTVDHPSEPVTADNWKQYAVGVTGEEVVRDGQFIRIPMMLKDAKAIAAVEGGKRQLSVGYSTKLAFEKGTTQDGLHYDAKQTIIRANHISVVGLARGGPELRIGDEMPDVFKTVRDGVTIEVNDAFIASLDAKIKKLGDDLTASAATIAAKDKELGTKDAEIDSLKAKVLDAKAIDALVAGRASLITQAKALHDADYSGKSDMEIRKAVLTAKSIAHDGKSDDYVTARFEALADTVKDGLATALGNGGLHQTFATDTYQAGLAASKKMADGFNAWRKDN